MSSSLPLKGIIFDLDGTLANTLPQLAIAARRSCEAAGLTPPDQDTVKTYVGNGVTMLLTRAIAGRREATPEEVDPRLLEQVRGHFNVFYREGLKQDFTVYPGVMEGLRFMRSLGLKLAVCTNKPQIFAKPLLEYMGVAPLLDCTLGGEVIRERKPDPAPILYVCQRLGLEPSSCLMVGDSENDVLGGQNAQMRTVFLTYGYFCGDPATIHPDYTFNRFSELTAAVSAMQ